MICRVMLRDPRQGGDVIFRKKRREGNRSPRGKYLARPRTWSEQFRAGINETIVLTRGGFSSAILRRNCGDTGGFRSVLKQFAPSVLVIVSNTSPCKLSVAGTYHREGVTTRGLPTRTLRWLA